MGAFLHFFLSGSVFLAALVCALFFLRFWRDSGDRFFVFFSGAFALMAFERIPLLVKAIDSDTKGFVYIIRLCAFILILAAIIHKNRSNERPANTP